jgi:hypothetical protein
MTSRIIELSESCKESWFFFEENFEKFNKKYEMNKSFSDYKALCNKEGYNGFRNMLFGLRLKSLVNKCSATKDKRQLRYYIIKESIKNKYENVPIDDEELEFE